MSGFRHLRPLNPYSLRAAIAVVTLVTVLTAPTSARAQRDLKEIPVPDPELERATFRLPEGFEVNLFAADPAIAKPIQMNFDEFGRLWIVSSEVYPHIEPGAEASDRVLVLEDTDHDGTSDKTHIFASGLLIPTGVAPGDGGAYVANSTELLHFSDIDNDLKADSKRVVLSGFGTEDTHHILHTLRWGPDGFLYMNQSIYIHSHIETPWGVRRLNAGGIWQFRPETLELGVFMRGLVNSWGHHFDRFGQSFATDGAGGEGINYVIPGAYYFTAADAPEILHGLNPGSPKHCGLEIVETPSLPEDWQGSAITNDFRGHRLCRFVIAEDRSGYVSREQQEVIASDHVAFRPIDVKLGPDGAIYIADWYNPIIQHGEVDFRDPRRDHTHGRIWRVSWKGARRQVRLPLHEYSNTKLFDVLRDSDNFRRQAAHNVLRQRGPEITEDLKSWLAGSVPVNADTEQLRLEALWCFQAARAVNDDLLQSLLNAEDGRVRAAAVRVLSHWKYAVPAGVDRLKDLVSDPHPRVRLEAVRALSYSPLEESEFQSAVLTAESSQAEESLQTERSDPARINAVLQATDAPTDTFLDYAIRLSVRELAPVWQPAFRNGSIQIDSVDHLLTLFGAVGSGAPVDVLLHRAYEADITADKRTQVASIISSAGTPDQLAELVKAAAAAADSGAIRTAVTQSRERKLQVPMSQEVAEQLEAHSNPEVRAAVLAASGQWKWPDSEGRLTKIAGDQQLPENIRMAAMEGLALGGQGSAAGVLQSLAGSPEEGMTVRKHAAAMLTLIRPNAAAKVAAAIFSTASPEQHPEDLVRSFLALKNGETVLAEAVRGTSFGEAVGRELLRVVRESGRPAPQLEEAIRVAGRISSRKAMTDEQKGALLNLVRNSADPAIGEQIYRNEKLGCLKCHAIGGAGGKVGPDMISLGGSAQPDYLLESLLLPNAKVKENYNTLVVATKDGRVTSGVQVKRANDEVIVRTAEDKLITIPGRDIEEIAAGVSLMPEGQVDALTDQELASLVRFLSELGRTPDYSIGRRQLARTWHVMLPTDQAAYQLRRTSYASAATDHEAFVWQPRYSTVAGHLPLTDIPVVSVRNRSAEGSRGVGFTRCYLNVETPGKLRLKLNDTVGLELRLGEAPIDVAEEMAVDVEPGRQQLTFSVDDTIRSSPIELELVPDGTSAVCMFAND